MIDPRIIPPGEVLPPMDLGERPARRNGRAPTDAEPKRKPGRGGGAVRRRFALLNVFIDAELSRCTRAELAAWLLLYRHAKPDGIVTASVADLARRAGRDESAMRRALKRLREAGLVERVKRGTLAGGPSVWRLLAPEWVRP